ncbi:MAG: glucosyltransferase [Eubacteriales bacterium]|nr:glucosyltransferase [Eubacteriales bacterium]
MATIVFFCIPAHGHTNPTLNVVRELTARGHRVVYYSYDDFREKIEDAGAEFVSCNGNDAQLRLTREESVKIGSDLALSTRVLVDTTLSLDGPVCREMERFRPDCIVADSMAVWGKAVAKKLGIPYVCSTTTFAFNRESAKIMPHSLKEMLSMLTSMGRVNAQIKRLQEAGYPVKNVLELIGSDESVPTVVYTSPMFQPCAETFPAHFAFVGPSIRPARSEVAKTARKLVYISMGTVNNDMLPLYRDCIQAVEGTGWQVILSVGDQVDVRKLGNLPENVSVHPSVDQIAVLEQADAFLTHCGMNSASEGLYFGVPLVMLPQTSEQGGVAARTEQLGAGLRLKKTTPGAIRAGLEAVMNDPSYRENAGRIGASFRSAGGAKAAADCIERCFAAAK